MMARRESSEHVVGGSPATVFARLILRVAVEAVLQAVEVELDHVGGSQLPVDQLVLVQRLEEVNGRGEVEVKLCEDVAVLVFFDVLKCKLLHHRALAEEIRHAAFDEDVAEDDVFLVLANRFLRKAAPSLVLLKFFGEDSPILVQLKQFLHGGGFLQQHALHVCNRALVGFFGKLVEHVQAHMRIHILRENLDQPGRGISGRSILRLEHV